MDTGLEKVLRKMCEAVGAVYEDINFEQPNWFWSYSWTQAQENEFKEWLKDQIKQDRKVKGLFKPFSVRNKAVTEKTVDFFVSNYGWKLK